MCSGGADSVALVLMLHGLPRGAAPKSLEVLWLDHALRADTRAEYEAASKVASAVGARLHVRTKQNGFHELDGGLEAAARSWRYEEAIKLAKELGIDVVCTGHTASDQLEQTLLSLIGVTGRSGEPDVMPVSRTLGNGVHLVRPLLASTRSDVERICEEAGFTWGNDPTNSDADSHMRNAVRHRVIPPLLDINESAGAAMVRAGARNRERHTVVKEMTQLLLEAWKVSSRLDVRLLQNLSPATREEVIVGWLARSGIEFGRSLSTRNIHAIEALALRPRLSAGARVDLANGACVRREGYDLVIARSPHRKGK